MSLLTKLDLMSDMSKISRYSQSHLAQNESVLEHTGFVAMLAFFIGNEINIAEYEEDGEGLPMQDSVNLGGLLSRALMHDVDEVITGDLPRPTKYNNEALRREIEKVERANMISITRNLGSSDLFYAWRDAKDDTIAGAIIRLCDTIAVLHKIRQEFFVFGNSDILGHVKGIGQGLASQRSIATRRGFRAIIPYIDEAELIRLELVDRNWSHRHNFRKGEGN